MLAGNSPAEGLMCRLSANRPWRSMKARVVKVRWQGALGGGGWLSSFESYSESRRTTSSNPDSPALCKLIRHDGATHVTLAHGRIATSRRLCTLSHINSLQDHPPLCHVKAYVATTTELTRLVHETLCELSQRTGRSKATRPRVLPPKRCAVSGC